jgi:hypothetical protein
VREGQPKRDLGIRQVYETAGESFDRAGSVRKFISRVLDTLWHRSNQCLMTTRATRWILHKAWQTSGAALFRVEGFNHSLPQAGTDKRRIFRFLNAPTALRNASGLVSDTSGF